MSGFGHGGGRAGGFPGAKGRYEDDRSGSNGRDQWNHRGGYHGQSNRGGQQHSGNSGQNGHSFNRQVSYEQQTQGQGSGWNQPRQDNQQHGYRGGGTGVQCPHCFMTNPNHPEDKCFKKSKGKGFPGGGGGGVQTCQYCHQQNPNHAEERCYSKPGNSRPGARGGGAIGTSGTRGGTGGGDETHRSGFGGGSAGGFGRPIAPSVSVLRAPVPLNVPLGLVLPAVHFPAAAEWDGMQMGDSAAPIVPPAHPATRMGSSGWAHKAFLGVSATAGVEGRVGQSGWGTAGGFTALTSASTGGLRSTFSRAHSHASAATPGGTVAIGDAEAATRMAEGKKAADELERGLVTDAMRAAWASEEFTLGDIPEVPPPVEHVRPWTGAR